MRKVHPPCGGRGEELALALVICSPGQKGREIDDPSSHSQPLPHFDFLFLAHGVPHSLSSVYNWRLCGFSGIFAHHQINGCSGLLLFSAILSLVESCYCRQRFIPQEGVLLGMSNSYCQEEFLSVTSSFEPLFHICQWALILKQHFSVKHVIFRQAVLLFRRLNRIIDISVKQFQRSDDDCVKPGDWKGQWQIL